MPTRRKGSVGGSRKRADEPEVGSSTGLRDAAVKPFETSEGSVANLEYRRAAELLQTVVEEAEQQWHTEVPLLRSPEDTIMLSIAYDNLAIPFL